MNIKLNKQTIFSDSENGVVGNCFQTCVANLLGLDIDEVPHFYNKPDPISSFHIWLSHRGLKYIEFRVSGQTDVLQSNYWGYHMIMGPSPRYKTYHAVIGLNGNIYFDPHPDNTGLVGDEYEWKYGFIVKA